MSAQWILGLAFALVGTLIAYTSWSGLDWFRGSCKDDHVVLWIGEEGARLLDVGLGLCFALGGLLIGLGIG